MSTQVISISKQAGVTKNETKDVLVDVFNLVDVVKLKLGGL